MITIRHLRRNPHATSPKVSIFKHGAATGVAYLVPAKGVEIHTPLIEQNINFRHLRRENSLHFA